MLCRRISHGKTSVFNLLGLGSGAATLDEVASGALAFGPVDGRQGSWWQLAGELV